MNFLYLICLSTVFISFNSIDTEINNEYINQEVGEMKHIIYDLNLKSNQKEISTLM